MRDEPAVLAALEQEGHLELGSEPTFVLIHEALQ